ncbi:MAG TPA: hypothetical protein VFC41_01355, partial [Anaerovoracaceae bacterium]|nr:hypothetical protein [Anaerovoracaceae bacterium]
MRQLGRLVFFVFVVCSLLAASCSATLFQGLQGAEATIGLLADGFSINLQSPDDGITTADNMPDFKFVVTHPDQLTVTCSLWLQNAAVESMYATQNLVANGALTTLTPSLPIPNGVWQWWINCSDGTTSIVSETKTITLNVFREDRTFSASYDGNTRHYWLDLPDDFDSSEPTPLVIILPGYDEDYKNMYQTDFSVFRQIFHQNGWLV